METNLKLTKSQKIAFFLMLARAREEWYVATASGQPSATFIPLTRYYKQFNAKCRPWVLAAWDIFFERISRGDQRYKLASAWVARPSEAVLGLLSTNETNGAQAMKKLTDIYKANKDTLVEIRKAVYTKQEDGKPVSKVEIDFIWPDEETQRIFHQIAVDEWVRNPQAEWKNEDK